MGILDNVGIGRVDVVQRVTGTDNIKKVIIKPDMLSSELYAKSDYRMLWLSFEIDYDDDFSERYSNLWDVYDFLDYHPDVVEHTSVYVVRYFPTMFVHPNIAYQGDAIYRAMVGVCLDVRSRYYALRTLYGIYRFLNNWRRFYGNPSKMTVYWKFPKDEHHYEDYEYNYDINSSLFRQFWRYIDGDRVNKTAFDLVGFIYDGTRGCMCEDWHKALALKGSKRYYRDQKKMYR